jgi:hypothetical protein
MTLLTLEIWCRLFIDGRGVPDVAEELAHVPVAKSVSAGVGSIATEGAAGSSR